MPRVEIVEKHNMATRRLYIRGHNGKIYAYLIMQESGMGDARREEIVLQLMRMLNHYLTKQKVCRILILSTSVFFFFLQILMLS